ncbi:hypothetical protein [Candidatus Avelusimicrobium faecicola]|uniref:hypothetical protein n=1 Tax=Candidatus Avelusimicrobium faecicola TaxID=3416205 RepID=UPI002045CDDB|nr:MAG TPA: Prokaryotic membrane lipoprotein lipid attachment site [Caudoviricetes sp.]
MKKLLVLLPVFGVLAGCAAGINHNVAKINGRTYLVETKNKNVFGLAQWSQESTFVDLENKDIGKELAKEYVHDIAAKCRKTLNIRAANANTSAKVGTTSKAKADPKEVYECVIDALTK